MKALMLAAGAAVAWVAYRTHKLGHVPHTLKELLSTACCADCAAGASTCGGGLPAQTNQNGGVIVVPLPGGSDMPISTTPPLAQPTSGNTGVVPPSVTSPGLPPPTSSNTGVVVPSPLSGWVPVYDTLGVDDMLDAPPERPVRASYDTAESLPAYKIGFASGCTGGLC